MVKISRLARTSLVIHFVKDFAVAAFFLGLLVLVVHLYLAVDRLEKTLAVSVSTASAGISQKADALTADIHGQLAPVTSEAAGLLKDVRAKVSQVDVAKVNRVTTAAAGTATALTAAVKPIGEAATQVSVALPDFLDCQEDENGVGNRSCLYDRWADLSSSLDRTLSAVAKAAPSVSGSVERTAAAVADNAPKIANSVADTAGSVAGIAATSDELLGDVNKPKTLAQKAQSWIRIVAYVASRFL